MRRLGVAERNAALVGDLAEEFGGGRSSGWYWRQALVAIGIDWLRNFRAPHRYWSAVFAGWAVQFCVVLALWHFHLPGRACAIATVLILWALQIGARRRLVGDRFEWSNVRELFLGHETGPWFYFAGSPVLKEQTFYWGRIPLAVLVACDEFVDDLVCYLLFLSFSPVSLEALLSAEIVWLLTHEPVRCLAGRIRLRLKRDA